jgi:hypothetical protein
LYLKVDYAAIISLSTCCFCYNSTFFLESANIVMIFIRPNLGFNLRYILAIINSSLMNSIYRLMNPEIGEVFAQVKSSHIKRLPIRLLNLASKSDQRVYESLITLVNQVLEIKEADPTADVSALERQIDTLVYELYGLTAEEVAIVEGVASDEWRVASGEWAESTPLVESGQEQSPNRPISNLQSPISNRQSPMARPLVFTGRGLAGSFGERRKEVERLAKLGTPGAIQELVAALGDENATIRWMAGSALRGIGAEAAGAGAAGAETAGRAEVRGVLAAFLEVTENPMAREEAANVLRMLEE